jgi:hypothetical protein
MATYGPPSSASYHTGYRRNRSTLPKSTSRRTGLYSPSILHDGTRRSTRQQTSNDTSFYSTRHESSRHGRRTSRSHQHDRSRYSPNPGSSVSERRRTRDPTHTYCPRGFRLWKHRPPTQPTTDHSPALEPAALRSCLKGANGSRSRLPSVAFQVPHTNQTKTSHDSRTFVDRLFGRFRNRPSSLRTEAPRTRTAYHHKSRREPKKKKKNRKHKRRESANDLPDSTHQQYTQRSRHRRKHATERSVNDREKRHNRYTHRQMTERHTSYSKAKRNDTRPSVNLTKRRTKHQRARHPSEGSDWYAPHTTRTRTHHARPSRIHRTPRCRVIQTTRTTKGHRYRVPLPMNGSLSRSGMRYGWT